MVLIFFIFCFRDSSQFVYDLVIFFDSKDTLCVCLSFLKGNKVVV